MKQCSECGQPLDDAEYPKSYLKALGQYPTHYMTVSGNLTTVAVTSGFTNAEIAVAAISGPKPIQMYQKPGIPVSAFPLIKDVGVRIRTTAGGITTPPTATFALLFRDNAGNEHFVKFFGLEDDGTINGPISDFTANLVLIPAVPFQSANPTRFGQWVMNGTVTLGTATALAFDVYSNLGILYGAP